MKKAAKIFAIIGVCTLFFGIFICIAGYAMGARFHSLGLWDDAIMHYSMYGYGNSHNNTYTYVEDKGYGYDAEYYKKITADIENLDVDMNWGNCSIAVMENLDYIEIIGYEIDEDDIEVEVSGNTLRITYDYDDGSAWSNNHSHWEPSTEIQINIPKKEFASAKFESGVGKIVAENLNVGKLEVYADAGSFEGYELTVSKNTILDVDAGSISINGLIGGVLNADCEAGNIEVYEAVVKGGELNCEVGNISLLLNQEEEEHNYTIDCEMGNIDVGSVSYRGFDRQRNIDNGAPDTLKLDCEMGNIEVMFQ